MEGAETKSITVTSDGSEPKAMRRDVPVWLLIFLLLLIYWAMLYFDQHGGWFSQEVYSPSRSQAEVVSYQPVTGEVNLGRGKMVFESVCGLCHNNDGMGKPSQAPPLVGSEWVLGSPARLIRIPMYGLNGPITVKGQPMEFPAGMLAVGASLPEHEDDVAAVLSYVRQAWGNKASPISADQVRAVVKEVGNHPQSFAPKELMELPEK